jgi:hypothetical protein
MIIVHGVTVRRRNISADVYVQGTEWGSDKPDGTVIFEESYHNLPMYMTGPKDDEPEVGLTAVVEALRGIR